jgi:hypothetical protein
LVRNAVEGRCCRTLVRILAQGIPTEGALLKVQQALKDEVTAIEPLLLFALKSERGAFFNLYGLIVAGEMTLEAITDGGSKPENWLQSAWSWLLVRPRVRMIQIVYLEKMTQAVAIAELPSAEQQEALVQFEEEIAEMKQASPQQALGVLLIPAVRKVLSSHQRASAKLDCARTAIAAERYRLARGRWPQSLAQLVPEFLEEVPQDVFGTGPLRSRRLKDSLLVYSVGPNGDAEPDSLTDKEAPNFEPEVGFRLWDVEHRGKRRLQRQLRRPEP